MALILSLYRTDMRPGTDNTVDIGTSTYQFKDLFINGTAYLDALTMEGDITLSTHNIITDTTTGTKIGTAIDQKLGFFNATPIIQPINTTDIKDVLVNLGLMASGGISPLNLDGGDITCGGITASELVAESGVLDYALALISTSGVFSRDPQLIFDGNTLKTINVFLQGSLTSGVISTPSNPLPLYNTIYFKSDNCLYKLDSSGNEIPLDLVESRTSDPVAPATGRMWLRTDL